MPLYGPTCKWGLAKTQVDFQVGPSVATKKRRSPTKIYQKEVFYKPKTLHMELTHKLRIGYIYYANVCLWNICTGYKSHYSMHFYNVSISNYFQFQSPNLKGAIIKKKNGKIWGKVWRKSQSPFPFFIFPHVNFCWIVNISNKSCTYIM